MSVLERGTDEDYIKGTNEKCTYVILNGVRLSAIKYRLNDGVEHDAWARIEFGENVSPGIGMASWRIVE